MAKEIGMLVVSHVNAIANGVSTLLDQVAQDVTIKAIGGTEDGEVGTDYARIQEAMDAFEEDKVWAFYDLGSAKMNLEIAMEATDKAVRLFDTAFVESAYTAASLIQAEVGEDAIVSQLDELKIKE
ncbi:dihydroxyacetone kinase phosphoryl donor subunit DhaM [Marinilactibacillus kalidii]|uniref:dihydroxyacetone kinase phosphoryl donor subunit DhaM n=1 Tax=Marinilactibacillus kalidii TaxID=2820274 RepID=UPI001ABDB8CE|nr:dihydroxyacetone kinase phosphoryl donor subunit DhaM [Marinilactibacillus kalidii]